MLKSNTKKAIENVRTYVINNFTPDNYSPDFDYIQKAIADNKKEYVTKTDIFSCVAHAINSIFYREALRFDNRYRTGIISRYEMFKEWCSGLPSIIDTGYYYNRSAVEDVAIILQENDAEKNKYTEEQAAELLTRLIYREIYKVVIR